MYLSDMERGACQFILSLGRGIFKRITEASALSLKRRLNVLRYGPFA